MVDLDQIRSWADEAVSMAKEVAGVMLDYKRASVGALEQAMDALRQRGIDDDETWDLACRFGAYLGQVMLGDFADLGYEWAEDYDGEPCLITTKPQKGASLDKILPITKANKYLISGPSESAAKLYASCLSMLLGGDMRDNLSSLGVDASSIPGVEPAYVNKGRFDANAAAWLLYGDYVFFRQQEISWDGTTHRMLGGQINAAKMNDIPTLVANTSLLNGMLDLLTELEKDEGLRVPLDMIHPGLHGALRNEDLTGITLFNLMACAQALVVKEPEPNSYAVMCDHRLPMGIPSFYQLVARMIWDMRAYNERSGAYKVTFANARNIDADVVLDDVDRMVPGAFSQGVWQTEVLEKPQVQLPPTEEVQAFVRELNHVFISGFENPMDIQADEELFVATLNDLAREMPIVQDIEGTGYLDRVSRIEYVKVSDPLVLAADWQNEWFDPVCLEVFNAAGETLGNLSMRFSPTLSGYRELACLLPHITATVETVTPKSKRRRNAKYALMDVRMELDPSVLDADGNLLPEVIRDAKALLTLPRGERVVVSKGKVVASQLKGNIKVDEAHDVPNPVGKTFHLWEVELPDEVAAEEPQSQQSAAPTTVKQPEVVDTGCWTFDEHQRVQARRFSIEVPDQYVPVHDETGRILAQFTQGIDDEAEYPEIVCNSMMGDLDDETREAYCGAMIPEMRIQTNRNVFYSNDLMNKLHRIVNDWVVEGKNCQVQVFEVRIPSIFADMFPDSFEYTVKPVAYDHEDFMRVTDSHDHIGKEELKALAFAVARSVELDKPVELERIAQLDSFCQKAAEADAFCENVNVIGNMLAKADSDRMNANLYRVVRQADNEMRVLLMGDTMPLTQAEALNEGLKEQVAYYGRYVEALEKQAALGTTGFDTMWKALGQYAEALIVDHASMEDKEAERKVNALGVIAIPEEYAALRERYEALEPGSDGRPISIAVVDEDECDLDVADNAAAEAANRADELERDASGGQQSELFLDQEGLLADTPALAEGFGLAYGEKSGDAFALRTRSERLKETLGNTLVERERVATAWRNVRTQLVYVLQAIVDKRTADEARRKAEEEAKRRAEEEAQRRAEEEARRKAEEEARRKAEEEARRRAEEERRKAEEEARRRAEEEESRKAEDARKLEEERHLAELREKWAREAAIREGKEPASAASTSGKVVSDKGASASAGAVVASEASRKAESERIARENAARKKKLEELQASWAKEATAKDAPQGGKATSPEAKQEQEKPKGKILPLLIALLVVAAIVAAVVVFSGNSSSSNKQEAYESAVALVESGEYAEAAAAFRAIDDYEDAATQAKDATAQARAQIFGDVNKGDIVKLGSYEQDNDTSNGPEPIEWIVLNVVGDKALLLSQYGLDVQPYNKEKKADNSWGHSDLKSWMSSTFYPTAFSETERLVYVADVPTCLNINEAKRHLTTAEGEVNQLSCVITPYAAESYPYRNITGAYVHVAGDTAPWWLRQDESSTGEYTQYAPNVLPGGTIVKAASGNDNLLVVSEVDRYDFVRPAVYVYVN